METIPKPDRNLSILSIDKIVKMAFLNKELDVKLLSPIGNYNHGALITTADQREETPVDKLVKDLFADPSPTQNEILNTLDAVCGNY